MVTPASKKRQQGPLQTGALNALVQAEIRAEMARQGLGQTELGRITGDSQKVIARAAGFNYEGSQPGHITLDELDRLCRGLRVDPIEMVERARRATQPQRRAS
jgi:DNA-binding Xre family transcriptional regulator